MKIANSHYLTVDLEATCSQDGCVPREEMEVIEIGAVAQNSRTFEVVAEFQAFVRPVRHPRLTEFCAELTIRQADVDVAPSFAEALRTFRHWIDGIADGLFCSWGDYDRRQLQDCRYHRIEFLFPAGHLNLKAAFAESQRLRRPAGVAAALKHLGMRLEGTHHRALDDARNMARIVRRVCGGL